MLRFLTAGESHGPALTAIIEGYPAGVSLSRAALDEWLRRRQSGYGRGGRMQIEQDRVEFLSGVRNGVSLGSPLTLLIRNRDWENWQKEMAAEAGEFVQEAADSRRVTRPRPGHADLAGALKYRQQDLRNILERASARETAIRVAVGAVAAVLLKELGCRIFSQVVQIGRVVCPADGGSNDMVALSERTAASPVGCADPEKSLEMIEEIRGALERGDTLGGVIEVIATGLPPGLGSHVHWDRRLDGRLAAAVMSIPSVKGVEIGLGFRGTARPGSKYHDPICYDAQRGFYRPTNHAGGVEGGITNGEHLVLRAAVKPVPTLKHPMNSVDLLTKEEVQAAVERGDACVVPAAAVIAEAAVAWVLAEAVLEKFGGDTLDEIKAGWRSYIDYLQRV